jgi:DNA-binding CsgD family transcriptional regulator
MTSGVVGGAAVPVGAAVPSLVRWGLTSDADLVFRTIVTLGPRSAGALARELGLPLRRVDEALSELRAVGAARPVPRGSRPALRTAVWVTQPPDRVVGALRLRRRRRPVDQEAQAREHLAVVTGLPAACADLPGRAIVGGLLGEGVRYLSSRQLTRRRLAELVPAERHEHLAINTEQVFEPASARAAAPLGRIQRERSVRMRILGLPAASGDDHVDRELFGDPLFAYREAPRMPMKLIVVDRRFALFPVDPRDFERGYLEISQPAVVRALVGLFEQHWAAATDPRTRAMPDLALTDRERALIVLLAQGHTDASAAAQLRISTRSVTNIMRGLMDRFGVDNRFQLGLALGAARAAELPPSPPPRTAPSEEGPR